MNFQALVSNWGEKKRLSGVECDTLSIEVGKDEKKDQLECEERRELMLDSWTERGYTNETTGNAIWKGQGPWGIEGKMQLGKKAAATFKIGG